MKIPHHTKTTFKLILLCLMISLDVNAQVIKGTYQLDGSARTEVIKPIEPYFYVCHLIVHRSSGTFPSTGFLVSDKVILTAGHSVGEYRILFKNKIRSVEVKLCEYFEDGTLHKTLLDTVFNRSAFESVGAHPDFKGNRTREPDYGHIKLKDKINNKGHFEISEFDKVGAANDTVYISGYPGDLQGTKPGSMWTKFDLKKNFTVSPNYLTYGIFTHEGDSGAPIWIKSNNRYHLVGIHNTGYTSCNGGTKVNADVIKYLKGIIGEN